MTDNPSLELRTCRVCHVNRPAFEFSRSGGKLTRLCKQCVRDKNHKAKTRMPKTNFGKYDWRSFKIAYGQPKGG